MRKAEKCGKVSQVQQLSEREIFTLMKMDLGLFLSIVWSLLINLVMNNLWWWTKSHYSSYPRFKPYNENIEEYNEKFMCGQFVLKGGCIATPKNHSRNTYRNFYEPHQRWMFSGIRLARDI